MIIAIDGYSSTGKSTVAKALASRLGMTYIDTGAMYRCVALEVLQEKLMDTAGQIDVAILHERLQRMKIEFRYDEVTGRNVTFLNDCNVESKIRGMEVSGLVSVVAALGFVREFLVEKQREMGRKGNVIMDGRDIGSVVFPNADVKFFMTASLAVRAERRFKELRSKGENVTYAEVEANVKERDYIDTHRDVSPLVQAEDAVVVDNSMMTVEEELEMMERIVRERMIGK